MRKNGNADEDTYVKSSIGPHNNVIAKIIPQKNEVGKNRPQVYRNWVISKNPISFFRAEKQDICKLYFAFMAKNA